jgi:predicted GNAT family acetyltransferase
LLPGLQPVVASTDDEDVATAIAFDHQGDRGIDNVGTIGRARRRGFATAVTAQLVHEAFDDGCGTATLQASELAERLYAGIGFRGLGRILEYSL